MALSDTAIRKAKTIEKAQKLPEGGGLYPHVTRTGFKSWRFKCRFGSTQGLLAFGGYPEVTLAEVREHKDPVSSTIAPSPPTADTERTFAPVARDTRLHPCGTSASASRRAPADTRRTCRPAAAHLTEAGRRTG